MGSVLVRVINEHVCHLCFTCSPIQNKTRQAIGSLHAVVSQFGCSEAGGVCVI